MTAHRAVNLALTIGLAVALAAILSTGHLLDDHAAEWPQSSALLDAQHAARAARQAELDAIRQCTHLHGPGAAMRYTPDGDLVCIARKGPARTVVVSETKGGAL